MHGRRRKRAVSTPTPVLMTDRGDATNVNEPLGGDSPVKFLGFGKKGREGRKSKGALGKVSRMFGGGGSTFGIMGNVFTGGLAGLMKNKGRKKDPAKEAMESAESASAESAAPEMQEGAKANMEQADAQSQNNATTKELTTSSKDDERKSLLERIGYIHNTLPGF